MAKDKERSINPAAQQRKAEKAKAIKKSKTEQLNRRNEQLAKRNPHRVQQQIDDLKALEASGQIKPREKTILAELERDLKAIKKAKETVGDHTPQNTRSDRPNQQRENRHNTGSVLGKRRHDGERKRYGQNQDSDSGNETDESVRRIPMPRDTPPPIPRRMPYNNQHSNPNQNANNPNNIPVASSSHDRPHNTNELPSKPPSVIEAKTTYSSAPQIRDLKKEAVSRFVPTAVKRKIDAVKGTGTALLEPEEMDRLEAEGYTNTQNPQKDTNKSGNQTQPEHENDDGDDEEEAKRLAEEEAKFQQELQAIEGADSMDIDIDEETGGDATTKDSDSETETHTHIQNIRISTPPLLNHEDSEPRTKSQNPNPNPNPNPTITSLLPNYASDSDANSDIESNLNPNPQLNPSTPINKRTPNNSRSSNGDTTKDNRGGSKSLFSSLPKPKSSALSSSRKVEIEEVEDEDL